MYRPHKHQTKEGEAQSVIVFEPVSGFEILKGKNAGMSMRIWRRALGAHLGYNMFP